EELELGARGVLGGELHVVAQLARASDARRGEAQDLVLSHVELVLAVNGARGEEHVDAAAGRGSERARGELDVLEIAARQAADARPRHLARPGLDALEVAARGGRRSDEHTSELQSPYELACRVSLAEKMTSASMPFARI